MILVIFIIVIVLECLMYDDIGSRLDIEKGYLCCLKSKN